MGDSVVEPHLTTFPAGGAPLPTLIGALVIGNFVTGLVHSQEMAIHAPLSRRAVLAALGGLAIGCGREVAAPVQKKDAGGARGDRGEVPRDAGTGPAETGAEAFPDAAVRFRYEDPAFEEDPAQFQRKRPAAPGDWLARFQEPDISFEQYADSRPVSRTAERHAIVIQPLGSFSDSERGLLDRLRLFTAAFFGCPTEIAQSVELPRRGQRKRTDGARPHTQYQTRVLLNRVLPPLLPKHAICLLGVTMSDLYPGESWNYVFGEATLEDRVGVYSLARYFPGFWGQAATPAALRLAHLRSFKVLSHEAGHMFSVGHCVRYECCMNGSNSLEEMDRQPAFLCPVCLKKLAWNLQLDVRARYRKLRGIYADEGLLAQTAWLDQRLVRIGN